MLDLGVFVCSASVHEPRNTPPYSNIKYKIKYKNKKGMWVLPDDSPIGRHSNSLPVADSSSKCSIWISSDGNHFRRFRSTNKRVSCVHLVTSTGMWCRLLLITSRTQRLVILQISERTEGSTFIKHCVVLKLKTKHRSSGEVDVYVLVGGVRVL